MKTFDIIELIRNTKKRTPVKVYLKVRSPIEFKACRVFGCTDKIIFGDWEDIRPVLDLHREDIIDMEVECDCRYSALPLADIKSFDARIEPGAIIRYPVSIGDHAIIMMGAIINVGACVGSRTLIDMNAVLGARVIVGENCHIGAGAVLAGVVEPPSNDPVIVEDGVFIGANAVILEGVTVGKGAVVAAGAVVKQDVPQYTMVAGVPAKNIKTVDNIPDSKKQIILGIRDID